MSKHIKITCLIFICLFLILPLCSIISYVSSNSIKDVLNDEHFILSIVISILQSGLSSIIAVAIAIIAAYFLYNSNIKHKSVYKEILSIPMLIPTLSIGLGIKLLFGNNGLFDMIFNYQINFSELSYLIICSSIMVFPTAFNIIYDSLQYENRSVYLSAAVFSISNVSTFFHLTLPYLIKPILYSFFTCFAYVFSDYGIPLEVAGSIKTLPVYLYETMTSTMNYGRTVVPMLIMLIPSIMNLFCNFSIKRNTNKQSLNQSTITFSKSFNVICRIFLLIISFIILLPITSFTLIAFVRSFPNSMVFSLEHFKCLFSSNGYLHLGMYIRNSLLLSIATSIFGTLFIFIVSYLVVRNPSTLSIVIDSLINASMCIPGLILGVCYVFTFNDTIIYNSFIILLIINIIHLIGSPYQIMKNAMEKLNIEYETVGAVLGKSRLSIICKVILPSSYVSLLQVFSQMFVLSMTTISSISFLTTYSTQPLQLLLPYYDKDANYEIQAVISIFILLMNLLIKGVSNYAIQKTKRKSC